MRRWRTYASYRTLSSFCLNRSRIETRRSRGYTMMQRPLMRVVVCIEQVSMHHAGIGSLTWSEGRHAARAEPSQRHVSVAARCPSGRFAVRVDAERLPMLYSRGRTLHEPLNKTCFTSLACNRMISTESSEWASQPLNIERGDKPHSNSVVCYCVYRLPSE